MENIPNENEIDHSYKYLKQFKNDVIMYIVTKYFSLDEKIQLLINLLRLLKRIPYF